MKFRKKPVVIEAVRYDGTEKCFLNECLKFLADGHEDFSHLPKDGESIKPGIGVSLEGIDIPTLEGIMLCRPGDWIVKGIQGEFYPIKNDIFRESYEEVKENEGN